MSIATEITRLNNAKASIKSAIEAKGVEVPQDAKIDIYADYIAQILQGGGTEYEPICFTSLEDGNTFQLNKEIAISVDDKQTWQTLAANTPSPAINAGEKIYFKAAENAIPFIGQTNYKFTTTKTCNVSGHPYSLYAKFSMYIFKELFRGTKIVDASGLDLSENVTTPSCYQNMFRECTSLVSAPELPSTKLAESCYSYMFSGCTSLVSTPELPATTLKEYSYEYMFNGCSNLNYIKALFTLYPSTNSTWYWVYGVAETGTFVKNSAATWTEEGVSGVPTGWTVVKDNA